MGSGITLVLGLRPRMYAPAFGAPMGVGSRIKGLQNPQDPSVAA